MSEPATTTPAEAPTCSIADAARLLGVGRKRATALIRSGAIRLLGGNPTRRQRMPLRAKVLVASIREALELAPDAPLPGCRELSEPSDASRRALSGKLGEPQA